MSPFVWRMLFALVILLVMFVITTITMTLVLVTEVRDNDVNDSILTYVEVSNWIMVGVIAITLLITIFATPYIISYSRKSESIVSIGLRSAKGKENMSTLLFDENKEKSRKQEKL